MLEKCPGRKNKEKYALMFSIKLKILAISRFCSVEDGKKMCRNVKRTCTVMFLLIKPILFYGVLVTVTVAVAVLATSAAYDMALY